MTETNAPVPKNETLFYKRSHFVAHLPVGALYTPSHAWLAREVEEEPKGAGSGPAGSDQDRGEGGGKVGTWRVGLTRFATRMLGEIVEIGLQTEPGTKVATGQIVGWIEGFKAISDLYCVVDGVFLGKNALLDASPELVGDESHTRGWLYRVRGEPGQGAMDLHAYRAVLDATIDKILAKEKEQGEDQGKEGSSEG